MFRSHFLAIREQRNKAFSLMQEMRESHAKHPKHRQCLENALDYLRSAWVEINLATADDAEDTIYRVGEALRREWRSTWSRYDIGETVIGKNCIYKKVAPQQFVVIDGMSIVWSIIEVKKINTAIYATELRQCLTELIELRRLWEKLSGKRQVSDRQLMASMVLDGTPFRDPPVSGPELCYGDSRDLDPIVMDEIWDRTKWTS